MHRIDAVCLDLARECKNGPRVCCDLGYDETPNDETVFAFLTHPLSACKRLAANYFVCLTRHRETPIVGARVL